MSAFLHEDGLDHRLPLSAENLDAYKSELLPSYCVRVTLEQP